MALLQEDDKQKKDDSQTGAAGTSGGSGSILGTSGEAATSGGGPTAGTGGQTLGGFTNIQDYLKANSGNTGSAQALKSQVGGAFDTEKQNVTQGATQAKNDAQTQVDQNKIGQDQASKMISESSSQYGKGGDTYDQDKQKIQGGLQAQYAGPSSYNYGLGADTQQYGQDLSNDQGYQTLMKNLYQKSSQGADARGAALGSGGMALQQQIDSGNTALGDTRKALQDQYAGLTPYVNDQVTSANGAIEGAKSAVQTNKNDLLSYLTGQSNQTYQGLQSRAQGADAAVQKLLGDVKSGYSGYWNKVDPGFFGGKTLLTDGKSPRVSIENLPGASDDVGKYNTINDFLLQGQAPIRQATPASLGDYSLSGQSVIDGRTLDPLSVETWLNAPGVQYGDDVQKDYQAVKDLGFTGGPVAAGLTPDWSSVLGSGGNQTPVAPPSQDAGNRTPGNVFETNTANGYSDGQTVTPEDGKKKNVVRF